MTSGVVNTVGRDAVTMTSGVVNTVLSAMTPESPFQLIYHDPGFSDDGPCQPVRPEHRQQEGLSFQYRIQHLHGSIRRECP